MNLEFFGDSYDLIKRTFLITVKELGFKVALEPMFTKDSEGITVEFMRLISADYLANQLTPNENTCLFIDPDTGIKDKASSKHISFQEIKNNLHNGYGLIIVFDQSFSRTENSIEKMKNKLSSLNSLGINGIYYQSHAKFLFASLNQQTISKIEEALLKMGIPSTRIIK